MTHNRSKQATRLTVVRRCRTLGGLVCAIAFLLVSWLAHVDVVQSREKSGGYYPADQKPTYREIVDVHPKLAPAVARVVCLSGKKTPKKDPRKIAGVGTGFLIAPLHLVTNYHVIDKCDSIRVLFSNGQRYDAEVVIDGSSKPKDIGILELEGAPTVPAVVLSMAQIPQGARIFSIGYPFASDLLGGMDALLKCLRCARDKKPSSCRPTCGAYLKASVKDGSVSGHRRSTKHSTRRVVHTIAISKGNSGGPVYDMCGRVVGVANGGLQPRVGLTLGVSMTNFAVDSREVVELAREAGLKPVVLAGNCRRHSPPPPGFPRWLMIAGVLLVVVVGALGVTLLVRRRSGAAKPTPPPSEPAKLMLVGTAGPWQGKSVAIPDSTLTIGREPSICNIVLPPETPGVSRKHAQVRLLGEGVQVRNLSSKGTKLDDQPTTGQEWIDVLPGQTIQLGESNVVFRIDRKG